MPLLQGRDFTADDLNAARQVVIVNRLFVERFLAKVDPLGRTLLLTLRTDDGGNEQRPYEIVGVVGDAKNHGVVEPSDPEAFVPYSAAPVRGLSFVVRTAGSPLAALKAVKRELWAIDPGIAVAEADSLESYLTRFAYAAPRLGLCVFTAFAVIGLVLVVVGVYSLIAYTISRQTREIGIRIAIGAGRSDVLRMTVGMGVRWLVLGGAIGLAASYAATRVVASELFEVSPTDPLTFGAVFAVLAVAGFTASYLPARRATRVDPIVVLRSE